VADSRFRIDWATPAGALAAIEPDPEDVCVHAEALAAAYNDPANAPLLGHAEPIDADEVVEHYADMAAGGAHPFLLMCDGALAGDGDLRKIHDGGAEFAFMIGAPTAQGKGLGTRYAVMIHAFGFGMLGLDRIYASIVPANVASRRVFDKLGYTVDIAPAAREFADDEGDIVMSIDRATFHRLHVAALAAIKIAEVG
jgi:RimJ/RimL family protein N-acetyltransferase